MKETLYLTFSTHTWIADCGPGTALGLWLQHGHSTGTSFMVQGMASVSSHDGQRSSRF